MTNARLEALFLLHTRNDIDAAEKEELLRLIADPASDGDLRELIARFTSDPGQTIPLPEESSLAILQTILATRSPLQTPLPGQTPNLAQTPVPGQPPPLAQVFQLVPDPQPAQLPRPVPRRLTAAAAILFLLAASTALFVIRHRTRANKTVAASTNDIAPGHNGAILTLADGKNIVLDSANNGILAQQGATPIQKASNNSIAYLPPAPLTPLGGRGKGGKGGSGEGGEYNTLTTPRGAQYQLTLPDGSRVWLNSASSLRYPTAFTGPARDVQLTGEAFFDIARDPAHPFTVAANDLQVNVLGTQFDVMAYADEPTVNTILLQGVVLVRGPRQSRRLAPGQGALLRKDDQSLIIANADTARALAWTTGFFQFNHSDLHSIMREIARWYDIAVVYQTDDNAETYGGRISRNLNLSVLIKFLEANGIHHFRIEDKKLIVLP